MPSIATEVAKRRRLGFMIQSPVFNFVKAKLPCAGWISRRLPTLAILRSRRQESVRHRTHGTNCLFEIASVSTGWAIPDDEGIFGLRGANLVIMETVLVKERARQVKLLPESAANSVPTSCKLSSCRHLTRMRAADG
jgi:hypothetical protein